MATTVTVPAWYRRLRAEFSSAAAHAFILAGCLNGYVAGSLTTPRRFLQTGLGQPRRQGDEFALVATYSLATGIQFQSPVARQRAVDLLAVSGSPAPADALSAALANVTGRANGSDPFAAATTPVAALRVLDQLLRAEGAVGQVSVIIDDAELIVGATPKAQMSDDRATALAILRSWARDETLINRAENLIILLTESVADLAGDLRAASSGWRLIDIPLPDEAARAAWLAWAVGERDLALGDDLTVAQLARVTAGLDLRTIDDLLVECSATGPIRYRAIRDRKNEIIRAGFGDVAEMLEPLPGGFADLGGLDWIKAALRRYVADPLAAGQADDMPSGVLLMGPPGTGKTFSVRAMAGELRMNCIKILAEKIEAGIVGESERNLARVLSVAAALAPTILFFDEVDQSNFGNRGNNSGNPVAASLFNQILQAADGSLRGRVLFVAATNRPDNLDPALLRRFDLRLPVLLPAEVDRRAIASTAGAARNLAWADGALDRLAELSNQWSAADVATAVRELALECGTGGRVGAADVLAVCSNFQPEAAQTADYFTRLAVRACNRRNLLPPQFRPLLDDRQALDRQIAEATPEPSGRRGRRGWGDDDASGAN